MYLAPNAPSRARYLLPRQLALQLPGELVTAVVRNPLQTPHSKWKPRPVVLLQREGARFLVMGLTTLSHFSDGTPRRRVPNPQSCGLGDGDCFFWGWPTWICVLDVGHHIGYADAELLGALCSMGVEVDMARQH